MKYAFIVICVMAAFVVGVILALKLRDKKDILSQLNDSGMLKKNNNPLKIGPVNSEKQLVNISMEMIPADSIGDTTCLKEITDSKLLGRINELIPGLSRVANNSNNAIQAAQNNGEVFYRAILPAGWKLTPSKAMDNAYRGFSRDASGIIRHQANWVPVELHQEKLVATNTVSAVMGVAAMIVGQYYMTQINAELGAINDGISKISNFQDNEYRSRVFSLIVHIKKLADFQIEILENNELRFSKITQLDNLEEECTKLLGQANLTLSDYAKRKGLDYSAYKEALGDAQNWFMYQKSLVEILYKISDLKYVLHLGSVSRMQCAALLPTYTKQTKEAHSRLKGWHQEAAERLEIDISKVRRKQPGLLYDILGFFNDDLRYCSIEEQTARMIDEQVSASKETHLPDTSDLYAKDVQLIIKGGKVFYLPTASTEAIK